MMSDYTQVTIYDILGTKPVPYKFDKPIRLIELFGGIGSQGRSVYDLNAIAPTLLSGMSHGNTVPYILTKGSDNNAEHQSE